MLCGIGMYYAISLVAAEELGRIGWKTRDYTDSVDTLIWSARVMPFDHRFREYPVMRFVQGK